ncbi:sigma-70 family RNA polymerase sigma factor [Nocardioides sp.]|uniref:sigma-70 family RNA polymerase sigma factor n=1 Tax=Nocardioides sp. TaxID=35761 RepID=UPI002C5A04A6|nr:sigma-70 family RNA polymerase sigma factor [Nocardioides sp.]HXH78942.1 sigma-70 family RNA polymerase sigma factor [Nocardioides sp.]
MRRERREAEFTEFYLTRRQALRRTAYVIVRDWHTAEDLTQQSMIKLYAAWPRVRRDTVDAFARKIVVNECISHLRRRREVTMGHLPDRAQRSPESPELDVGAALDMLPPRQRAVVALRYLDDLSVVDVALALAVTEGTVKSQTAKALATLRTHVSALVLAEEPR